jgi:hypothetical protein
MTAGWPRTLWVAISIWSDGNIGVSVCQRVCQIVPAPRGERVKAPGEQTDSAHTRPLQLSGTKKGCDQGACTVLVDGHRINSLTRKIYDDLLLGISKAEDRQGVVAEQ